MSSQHRPVIGMCPFDGQSCHFVRLGFLPCRSDCGIERAMHRSRWPQIERIAQTGNVAATEIVSRVTATLSL